MDAKQLESIHLRMGLADDKLALARKLTVDGYYNDAVSKAYYAMFYAGRALLLAVGADPHKHTGVVSLFGEYFQDRQDGGKVRSHAGSGQATARGKRLRRAQARDPKRG